jgi:hypothetical protein
MKGPDERIDAQYLAIYNIEEVKQQTFVNHARDHA